MKKTDNIILTVSKKIIRKGLFWYLPDKQFILTDHFLTFRKLPNLKDPASFSDKLQWLKCKGVLERYSKYADKLLVRKYVKKIIGPKYLVPLLGSWDTFDQINFDDLPDQFVMKTTHGCGYIYICKNKSLLDKVDLKKHVNKWMNESFYKKTRETQYKYCNPKIICEKYLEDQSGGLIDYKIFCFNGVVNMIEVHQDRFTRHSLYYVDVNWKKLPISVKGYHRPIKFVKKPKNLNKMLEVAEKLSKPFPYVRVDLYSVKNKVYFGELTFTPANALNVYEPIKVDYKLGNILNITGY